MHEFIGRRIVAVAIDESRNLLQESLGTDPLERITQRFSATLVLTRVAIAYLGSAWLPLVSVVSGLTDADAIAFSLSNLHRAGLVSTDWASFNLVLGALSNTFMKLFLVLTLGHRELFRHLLVAFLIIGAAGILTMVWHYDLSQAAQFQGAAAVPGMDQ